MIDKALSDCTPSVATTTDLDLDLSDSTDLDFLSPRSKVIDDLETPRFDGKATRVYVPPFVLQFRRLLI